MIHNEELPIPEWFPAELLLAIDIGSKWNICEFALQINSIQGLIFVKIIILDPYSMAYCSMLSPT